MKRLVIVGAIVVALSIFLSTISWNNAGANKYNYKDEHQTIYHQIYRASVEFNQSYYWMLKVAICESGLNPNVTNSSSGAAGLFQFMPATFNYYAYQLWWAPGTWLSPYNPRVASRLAAYMWSIGQARQWVCAYNVGYL